MKSGRNVFLTGEAGSGKTYVVNQYLEWLRHEGRGFAVTASTGIASTHVGGSTIHSWSGLGIHKNATDDWADKKLVNDTYLTRRLQGVDVLIIDEVSMIDAQFMDDLETMLRRARPMRSGGVFKIEFGKDPYMAWGGVQIIFVGDFFQLPPVVKDQAMRFAFESEAWKKADPAVCYLTEQYRQSDPEFYEILTAIRHSKITDVHRDRLYACTQGDQIPQTRLFTHNLDVDRINEEELDKLPGEVHTFEMEEEGMQASEKANEYLLGMLKRGCLSPQKLRLKVGARVMFTRNKYNEDKEQLWVNGTLGTVIEFDEDNGRPVVETIDGDIHVPDKEKWEYSENDVVKARIHQIPLKLAYAVTVHKSQGMTLDEALIDLSRAFEYGQGYVALSRVKSLSGLFIEGRLTSKAFAMHPRVVEADKMFREESEKLCKSNEQTIE